MITGTSTLLSHPKEFFRMRGLPLPCEGLHDHYMDMWLRSDDGMVAKVDAFNEYVEWCGSNGFSSPSNYRIDHAMQRFIQWARDVDPMKNGVLPQPRSLPRLDRRSSMNGRSLLSIDMVSANYSVMKWVAEREGIKVPSSWDALCSELDIHPFLTGSKMFRQYCFGNYMPSRYATLQKHVMALLQGQMAIPEEDLVYKSHDEIVLVYPEAEGYDNFMMRTVKALSDEGFGDQIKLKGTIYKTHAISDRLLSKALKNDAPDDPLAANSQQGGSSVLKTEYENVFGQLRETKKVLVGVSSNKFYAYFRVVVLNEPLQNNDLIFQHEGMTAIWLLNAKEPWGSS